MPASKKTSLNQSHHEARPRKRWSKTHRCQPTTRRRCFLTSTVEAMSKALATSLHGSNNMAFTVTVNWARASFASRSIVSLLRLRSWSKRSAMSISSRKLPLRMTTWSSSTRSQCRSRASRSQTLCKYLMKICLMLVNYLWSRTKSWRYWLYHSPNKSCLLSIWLKSTSKKATLPRLITKLLQWTCLRTHSIWSLKWLVTWFSYSAIGMMTRLAMVSTSASSSAT